MEATEEARQKKNYEERQKRLEKQYETNFYALDTKTTGAEKNHPIQVAVILYENGRPTERYNHYFMPTVKIGQRAKMVHGLTKKELKKKQAKEWTKGASELLTHFLTEQPDLPIVSHSVDKLYNYVLKPAYERVGNLAGIPRSERWRCTMKLAPRLPRLKTFVLDDVLEECDFERRDEDAHQDAMTDAECAAKVYMHMIKLPEATTMQLGFWTE